MTTVSPMTAAPARCRGVDSLLQLSHDVWCEVVENLRPSQDQSLSESKYDLANLSLVCRSFCAISRLSLFEEVKFSGGFIQHAGDMKDHAGWFSEVNKSKTDSLASSELTGFIIEWPHYRGSIMLVICR